jgi:hypothetical protein
MRGGRGRLGSGVHHPVHAMAALKALQAAAKVRGNVIGVSIKDGCSMDGPNDIKHCERATMHVSAGDGTCRLVGTHRLSL